VSDSAILPAEGGFEPSADPGDGQVDSGAPEQATTDEAPARQYLEVDDPDNRYVRIRVDGEEVEVPFNEALRGYSRTEDYTRKTQDVARLREEADLGIKLQAALAANPQATIRLLQEQYVREQAAAPEPEFDDPLEKMLHEERQARLELETRINAREADEQLQRMVGTLRSQFNANDEDIRNVVTAAYQQGLPVEMLPMVYKTMAFDRIQASVQAHRDQQAALAAEEQRRQQAAAAAGRTISNGTGSAAPLTDRVDTGQPMSLRQAIEAAYDQAGLQ
jgi:hypothetical protein